MKRILKPVVISVVTFTAIAAVLSLIWFASKGRPIDATSDPARDPRALAADAARPTAPAFRLTTFSGDVYSEESLRGQPALLMFWAPWCQVCQRELPVLAQFYLKQKPAPLRVLAIGFADTQRHVEDFVKAHPSTFLFPTAYDAEDRVAGDFGVNATPTFVLLDAQGHVHLVHRGGGISQNPQYQAFLAGL